VLVGVGNTPVEVDVALRVGVVEVTLVAVDVGVDVAVLIGVDVMPAGVLVGVFVLCIGMFCALSVGKFGGVVPDSA
jgi:hypothetical protein